MFLGTTSLTLDAKGRIAIPARYRARLNEMCGGKMVITYNPEDKCLPIYPYEEWLSRLRQMDAVQDQSRTFKAFHRLLYTYANEVDMDSNGRLLVPQYLREVIGLEKNSFLLGYGEKFELWSEAGWLQTREKDDRELMESFSSSSERMDIGFRL